MAKVRELKSADSRFVFVRNRNPEEIATNVSWSEIRSSIYFKWFPLQFIIRKIVATGLIDWAIDHNCSLNFFKNVSGVLDNFNVFGVFSRNDFGVDVASQI